MRGGRGEGILFGADLTDAEWDGLLAGMREKKEKWDLGEQYVIQPVVEQPVEDLCLISGSGVQACRRIGTYHAVNGRFVALGTWRTGPAEEKTCNRANGKTYNMGSVIEK